MGLGRDGWDQEGTWHPPKGAETTHVLPGKSRRRMRMALGTTAVWPAGMMGSQQHPIRGPWMDPISHPKIPIPSQQGNGDASYKSNWMSHANPTGCSI